MNAQKVSTEYKRLQDGVTSSTRKLWLASLGFISSVEEEGTNLFDELVARGRQAEAQGRKRWTKAKAELESTGDELAERLDQGVSGALRRMGVPSRLQVETLTKRVDKLVNQVDRLSGSRKRTVSRAQPKKSTAKRKTKAA